VQGPPFAPYPPPSALRVPDITAEVAVIFRDPKMDILEPASKENVSADIRLWSLKDSTEEPDTNTLVEIKVK
jgi:hypothetical protein